MKVNIYTMKQLASSTVTLSSSFQTVVSYTPTENDGDIYINGWLSFSSALGIDDNIVIEIKYNGIIHDHSIITNEMSQIIYLTKLICGIGNTYTIDVKQLSGTTKDCTIQLFGSANAN